MLATTGYLQDQIKQCDGNPSSTENKSVDGVTIVLYSQDSFIDGYSTVREHDLTGPGTSEADLRREPVSLFQGPGEP